MEKFNLSMNDVEQMAAQYWLKHGEAPTHLLMTYDQQRQFSKQFVPAGNASLIDRENSISSIGITNGCMIDIVVCRVMQSNNEPPEFPRLMRFGDD